MAKTSTNVQCIRKLKNKKNKNSAVLPGRHVLYPGKHTEAVGSKDSCSELEFFVLLHEKPPGQGAKQLGRFKSLPQIESEINCVTEI